MNASWVIRWYHVMDWNFIWFPDALAENDIPDYSDYVNEVARLANKMGKIHGVCLDTVRDSFNHNVPVGKVALSAYYDSCYWDN